MFLLTDNATRRCCGCEIGQHDSFCTVQPSLQCAIPTCPVAAARLRNPTQTLSSDTTFRHRFQTSEIDITRRHKVATVCANEAIPSINRIQDIQDALEAYEQTGSTEGQDIHMLDHRSVPPDEILESMNVPNLRNVLIKHGRIRTPYALPIDYEGIFEIGALSRREARPIPSGRYNPFPSITAEFMLDWMFMCYDDPSTTADELVPGDMEPFDELMMQDMPARLDFKSWPAQHLMDRVGEELFSSVHAQKEICEWKEWMGYDEVGQIRRPVRGEVVDVICMVGEARSGRLVWAPFQKWWMQVEESALFRGGIREKLRNSELALIALARRIARQVVWCIVFQYGLPEAEKHGYAILDRKQIGRAVREILGEDWFNLPFDLDGSLRNWSKDDVLKLDDEMRGVDIFVKADGEYP